MGFFDTIKDKAGSFASDAERAGKVTAAQARLLVLQNDLRKAERDLGHAAADLIEGGATLHPDLEPSAAQVREARGELRAKEAEIAALRATGAASVPAAAPVADDEEEAVRSGEPTVVPANVEAAAPAADGPPAKTAAAKGSSPGTRAAKKPAAKKAPAKKKPAAKKAPAKKTAANKPTGTKPAPAKATPKKPATGKPPAGAE